MGLLPASLSTFFQAQRTPENGSVNITVSSDIVDIASRVAPFGGAVLAAYSAPFFFAAATAGGFFLADQLSFFNYQIDEVWTAQALATQILLAAVAVAAIFLTPIISAAFAGQRAGAWLRDNSPLATNPVFGPAPAPAKAS